MIRTSCSMVVVLICAASAFAQQPRDAQPVDVVGTSTITGMILSDEREPKPLRRSRVTLNGAELTIGRTTITADDGSFTFERVPAGRYTLAASKDGYVPMTFGARRPNRPGARVVLGNGERRTVSVRLPRGAVITGTLTTEDGQPIAGVTVFPLAHRFFGNTGDRHFVPVGNVFSMPPTDDRGMYRLYGLPAGEYAVAAHVQPSAPSFRAAGILEVISQNDVRNALAAVRDAGRSRQPGSPQPAPNLPDERRRAVTLAPVYYPGTATPERATVVKLAAGEERSGVDFSIQYVPSASIEGYVSPVNPSGGLSVVLEFRETTVGFAQGRSTRTGPDGRFTFTGVAPGTYTVSARMPQGSPGTDAFQTLSATAPVVVNGEDVTGVTLAMQPGLTISGRVALEGTETPQIDFSALRIQLPLTFAGTNTMISMPPVRIQPDGRFSIAGVTPGPYHPAGALRGLRSPIGRWWLKSIVIRGREILDAPLEFRESADDAVITFSDRANELSGTVRESPGSPPMAGYVLVFSADRTGWFANSRRIAAVQQTSEGRYSVRNLPAGNYFVIATSDLDNLEWFDPQLLQQLAARAARVTIAENDVKSVDLTWMN